MPPVFARERIGIPQVIALSLLALFLLQCVWFAWRVPLAGRELGYIQQGLGQWHRGQVSLEARPSPATALLSSLPLLAHHSDTENLAPAWRWAVRLPFMLMGALLGASLWYVARRLYGNSGGYIALLLYAFSPPAIIRSATVQPEAGAAWGAFGAVFTAIAVAHTLYAPREVVLWNWRRILLLGVSIGLALASQLSLVYLLPLVIAFMLYLVPERRGAAAAIFVASCAIGFFLLLEAYAFRLPTLAAAARASRVLEFHPEAFRMPLTYVNVIAFFMRVPTVFTLLLMSLLTFALWKRTRYFGTAAPLIVFATLVVLGIAMPHAPGPAFYSVSLPFAYVFIAGICADLLQSRHSGLALGVIAGVLLGHMVSSLVGLGRI